MFQIFVRCTVGGDYMNKTFALDVESTETVESLQRRLSSRLNNLPISQMRLSTHSKPLCSDSCLNDYHITKESVLELTLRAMPSTSTSLLTVEDIRRRIVGNDRILNSISIECHTLCRRVCLPLAQSKNIAEFVNRFHKIEIQCKSEMERLTLAQDRAQTGIRDIFRYARTDYHRCAKNLQRPAAAANAKNNKNDNHNERNEQEFNEIIAQRQKMEQLNEGLRDITRLEDTVIAKVNDLNVNLEELLAFQMQNSLTEIETDYLEWKSSDLVMWLRLLDGGKFSDALTSISAKKALAKKRSKNSNSNSNTSAPWGESANDDEYLVKNQKKLISLIGEFTISGANISEINDSFLRLIGFSEADRSCLLKHITRLKVSSKRGNGRMCVGCMTNKVNSVLIPCGHQTYCMTCLNKSGSVRCPICRRNVVSKIQTYMAGF